MTKENKKIVIKLEDSAENIELWQQNIHAFMVYGKDLLNYLKDKHPETAKQFMENRKNGKGAIVRGSDYPCVITNTDGKFYEEQLEKKQRELELKFYQRIIEKPNEYVEEAMKKHA